MSGSQQTDATETWHHQTPFAAAAFDRHFALLTPQGSLHILDENAAWLLDIAPGLTTNDIVEHIAQQSQTSPNALHSSVTHGLTSLADSGLLAKGKAFAVADHQLTQADEERVIDHIEAVPSVCMASANELPWAAFRSLTVADKRIDIRSNDSAWLEGLIRACGLAATPIEREPLTRIGLRYNGSQEQRAAHRRGSPRDKHVILDGCTTVFSTTDDDAFMQMSAREVLGWHSLLSGERAHFRCALLAHDGDVVLLPWAEYLRQRVTPGARYRKYQLLSRFPFLVEPESADLGSRLTVGYWNLAAAHGDAPEGRADVAVVQPTTWVCTYPAATAGTSAAASDVAPTTLDIRITEALTHSFDLASPAWSDDTLQHVVTLIADDAVTFSPETVTDPNDSQGPAQTLTLHAPADADLTAILHLAAQEQPTARSTR